MVVKATSFRYNHPYHMIATSCVVQQTLKFRTILCAEGCSQIQGYHFAMRQSLLDVIRNSQKVLVMDGGQGTELESRGMDISNPLWSTIPFTKDEFWDFSRPCSDRDCIYEMYQAYLGAGAQLLSTVTYQTSFMTVCSHTAICSEKQYDQLLDRIVAFCRKCIGQNHYLIGTIGSYAAHVGAEYTGDYGPLPEKINFLEYFRPQLRNFNRNEAIDIIGLETISNFHEVKAILSWDDSIISKPFYVSLSVGEDGKLRDGTSLRELVSLFPVSNPNLLLMGVNCCKPISSVKALAELHKTLPDIPLLVYPNSGESYDQKTQSWFFAARPLGSDNTWQDIVHEYKAQGARVIGGCCRTTPKDIHSIAAHCRK